tara:strand:+ start:73 stop:195 length:123 start_codon:yes stop_codon:yes gene_type:complete
MFDFVAPLTGFEPAAYGLTVHRSTTKLQRQQGAQQPPLHE